MKYVTVLITDLDNTLFDWFEIWHTCFRAMLDKLVELSGVEEEALVRSFKKVHEEHGTSEYAFAITELECLREKHGEEKFLHHYQPAVDAYREARGRVLKLYPGVEETFAELQRKGCLLIGYTESQAYYTHYRLRHLNLDLLFDYIYSPADHELPGSVKKSDNELRRTVEKHTHQGEIKPNPDILLKIIDDVEALPAEVVYIGDSLMKDMRMALDAGVTCVHAAYGVSHKKEEYELLQKVTHWTDEDVAREQSITSDDVKPDHTVNAFGEVIGLFDFGAFSYRSSARLAHAVDAWKVTVDVQKHFNDLEIKIRQLALTFITAAFAGAALCIREDIAFLFDTFRVPLATLILVAGAFVWGGFYLMDRSWYHRLLIGAVYHGIEIERRAKVSLPELQLATAIGKASPSKSWSWVQTLLSVPVAGRLLRWLSVKDELHSSDKLDLFYRGGLALLLAAALVAAFAGKPKPTTTDTASQATQGILTESKHVPSEPVRREEATGPQSVTESGRDENINRDSSTTTPPGHKE